MARTPLSAFILPEIHTQFGSDSWGIVTCEYMLELQLRDDTTELTSLRDALVHVRDMRQRFRADLMASSGAPSQKHSRSELESVV